MNSERFSPNDIQQAPFSPKKKLHVKDKCSLADTVSNARESLKNAKDISARNLLAACSTRSLMSNSNPSLEGICASDDECHGAGSESDSSLDEIVAIEEENTDYVSEKDLFDSDEEEEIIEEIVEEYYDEVPVDGDDSCYDSEDSELEPLPPPIVIPDSLKVKTSDDEESCSNKNNDDDDDDDSGFDDLKEALPQFTRSDQRTKPPPVMIKAASERQHEKPKHESMRPSTMRGHSIRSPTRASEPPASVSPTRAELLSAPKTPTKESQPTTPKTTTSKTPIKVSNPTTPTSKKSNKEAQPSTPKAQKTPDKEKQPTTPKTPAKESQPTTPRTIAAAIKADSIKGHENRLRPGAVRGFSFGEDDVDAPVKGKRAGRNPFTKPALPLEDAETLSKTPPQSNESKGVWEKPEWTKNNKLRATGSTSSAQTNATTSTISAPKTAPQAPRKKYTAATPPPVNARSADDDDVPDKIGWEKPEWTKRKILRQTSRSETVFSGGRIERPIGGIRPIEEN